ncbi:MAG: hypothetical protein RBT11_09035 [Desulfobacterales bacterium]|jgi:hypothetical protein|nr:hypothetical protein [Desulfobacterales bacterium]
MDNKPTYDEFLEKLHPMEAETTAARIMAAVKLPSDIFGNSIDFIHQ